MLDLRPGDLCAYEDDGETPRSILERVLVFLSYEDAERYEGVFLCNDGSIDVEILAFVRRL